MFGDGGVYGAWAAYLERWQQDLGYHEVLLPPLEAADLTPDTWSRLAARLFDAIGGRLGLWSDAFSTAMARATTEFEVGRTLTQARVGLRAVLALTDHPGLPDDLRTRLRETVEQQIRGAQAQLEQQLDRMLQGGAPRPVIEARRRTVRENPLDAVLSSPAAAGPSADPLSSAWDFDPTARPRRIIALD